MRLGSLLVIASASLAALLAGQLLATAAPAAKESDRFQLVGFTAPTFGGGQGVLGFTLACQDEFPGSRMCTSLEVMETTEVPGRSWRGSGRGASGMRPSAREVAANLKTRAIVPWTGATRVRRDCR